MRYERPASHPAACFLELIELLDMAKKLFVGGLAWATDNSALQTAFEKFGEVSEAKVITERDTGRSRGFGFVTFADDADAIRAQEEMDGSDLDGRSIRVNEANERPDRGPRR